MAERASAETIIGTGARIVGDVSFDGPARILGDIEGTIVTKSDLQIGAGASCKANIDAHRLAVDGSVTGNVTARDSLELAANAKIEGDLITAKLVVAEGATFVGYCRVGPEASKAMANGQTSARARPASTTESKPAAAKQPEPVKAGA